MHLKMLTVIRIDSKNKPNHTKLQKWTGGCGES